MKNKIKALFITFIFLSVITVQASVYNNQISAKDLSKVLPVLNDIDCKFKQEKVLKNIEKPLLSSGNFSFKKQEGIFFETTYPIKSTTSYTNKDCEQINDIIMAICIDFMETTGDMIKCEALMNFILEEDDIEQSVISMIQKLYSNDKIYKSFEDWIICVVKSINAQAV